MVPPKPLPKRKGEAGLLVERLRALNPETTDLMMERKSRYITLMPLTYFRNLGVVGFNHFARLKLPASPPQNVQKKATPPRKTSPQLTPPVHYRHLAILPKQHHQSKLPPGTPAANMQDRTPGKKYAPCKTGLITPSGMTGTR